MTSAPSSGSHPRLLPTRERIERRAADLERYLNLWRIAIAGGLCATVLIAGAWRGYAPPDQVWSATVAAGYTLLAVAFHLYLSRHSWDDRLPTVVVGADIALVSLILLGLVVLDRSLAAVNSQLVFCGYFVAVAMAGLRSDPRVATLAAVAVPTSYAAVVFLAVAWRQVEFANADPQFGEFRWEVQIGRFAVLVAVTWMVRLESALGMRERTRASLDPLTGVFNRRYLEDVLTRELPRTRRRQQPLSVLLLDLDGFKGYNDTYGHLAGDRLLAEVASLLSGAIRAGDVIARYGGDEFVIVLPNTPGETARRVARELMRVVPSSVSLCAGVGCVGAGVDTVEKLLHAADVALARAKSAGPGVVAG